MFFIRLILGPIFTSFGEEADFRKISDVRQELLALKKTLKPIKIKVSSAIMYWIFLECLLHSNLPYQDFVCMGTPCPSTYFHKIMHAQTHHTGTYAK